MNHSEKLPSVATLRIRAKRLSFDDLSEQFNIEEVAKLQNNGEIVLYGALANKSIPDRLKLSNALLDAGTDPTVRGRMLEFNAFHVLFDGYEHDGNLELPLVKRLVEAGTDINRLAWKIGTPAQMFLTGSTVKESNYSQVFDYWFTLDHFDPFKKNKAGYSTYPRLYQCCRLERSLRRAQNSHRQVHSRPGSDHSRRRLTSHRQRNRF